MEYSINQLAKLSGVSSRTLRYYDEIGLLKPKRINSAGYRIYGKTEVDTLQQILFFKSFGMKLEDIKTLMTHPDADIDQALTQQYKKLLQQRQELDDLLYHLEKTIQYHEGESTMKDQEKFEYFKKQKLAENEHLYGQEIREKYGEETIEKSNQQWQNMTQEQYDALQTAEASLIETLNQLLAAETPDIESPTAKAAFDAHKNWLMIAAPHYSAEYHRNLAAMYVSDDRFASYYNEKTKSDSTELLKEIIDHYAK